MADIIYVNGNILTMTDGGGSVDALALAGETIIAAGSRDEVESFRSARTQTVDLGGATVLPGFHDAHVHLSGYGLELGQLDLAQAADTAEGLRLIREYAGSGWLRGSGFSVAGWGAETLTASALDAIWPDRPVALRSQDHHSAWFNSRALQLTGITADTPDPEGGRIARDASGLPTGLLFEAAASLALDRVPQPGAAELRTALDAAAEALAAMGITTVHHMAAEPASHWRAMADRASQSDYPLRVWACLPQEDLESAAAIGIATGQGGSNFTVGGAKFFTDGALGSATAWMLEPYEGTSDTGVAMIEPELLNARILMAAEAGLAPVIHAIGDAAVSATLDALEASSSVWQSRGLLPRIEHAQHVTRQDITRMARLGVIASMQPIHLTFDAPLIDRLLGSRAGQAFAFRQFISQGVPLAFGSDTPVAPPGVLAGIRAAVTRTARDGTVSGAEEAVTAEEALHAYTRGAALAAGRAHTSGRLSPGFDADLVVLSGSPLAGLTDLQVLRTVKGGTVTYDSGNLG